MTTMADSMEAAIDRLSDTVAGTSQCAPLSEAFKIEAEAIETIEEEEGFSNENVKGAALVITNNPAVANMYLHMKNKTARKSFLLHHMEKLVNKV